MARSVYKLFVIFEGLLTQGRVLKSLALHLTLANHHHICLTLFLGLNVSVYPFPFFQNHWRRLNSLAKFHWRASINAKKYCKKLQLQCNFSRIDNAQAGQSYPKIKNNGFLSKKNAFRSQRPNFRTFAIARHGFGLRTYDNPIYTNENV